jgi:cell division protein YceG involved in septum cleavage
MKITANKITIVLLIILATVFFITADYFYNIKMPLSPGGMIVEFTVTSGEGVKIISQKLAAAKIIRSAFYLQVYLRLHHLEAKIKAGKYNLGPNQSIETISKLLTSGDVVDREKDIKIIEGWKLDDISEYLVANKIAAASDFATIEKMRLGQWNVNFPKPAFLNDAPANASLEG